MDYAALLDGMIFGNYQSIPLEWIFLLSRTGLIHFLSASGYHTNVALEISKLLARGFDKLIVLPPLGQKFLRLSLIFTMLTFFAALTGWSSPMTRAYCSGLLLTAAEILERKVNRLHILAISIGFAILIGRGTWLSISLSITSTCAILFTQKSALPLRLLAPWLASAPIVIFFFHSLSYLSPLWNLIFAPPLAWLLLPLWLFTKALCSLAPIFTPIQQFCFELAEIWLNSLALGDQILGGSRWIPLFPWLLLSSVGIPVFFTCRNWKIQTGFLIGFSAFAILFYHSPILLVLNVGQGDSIFVEDSRGGRVLIDFGPPGYRGSLPRGSKELEKYGIGSLDDLLLTHLDLDHRGGLENLLLRHKIHHGLWLREEFLAEPRSFDVLEQLERTSTPFRILSANQSPFDKPCLLVNGHTDNDLCPICWIQLKNGKRILSTGDISEHAEAEALSYLKENPKVDFLKVPHHGSKSSSSAQFLEYFSGAQALISVGAHNRYHHPNPTTLSRLHEAGLTTQRTDQNGTIAIWY